MLYDFITSNRSELIKRCRGKVAKRAAANPAGAGQVVPISPLQDAGQGVPLFLSQLVDTLRTEHSTKSRPEQPEKTPAPTEIGRGAALHGADLMRRGYSVDEVVHDYGDICQAVTELAIELNEPVSTDEFHTLNRCLDNAIADAVTSYTDNASGKLNGAAKIAERQLQLIELAIQLVAAMKTGKIALNGATTAALDIWLLELRDLTKNSRPEIAPAPQTISLPKR